MTFEPVGESRADVEMGNEEEEEPLEEEIPRVRRHPKNRAERNKNMRIQDMLSTRSWCASCVEGRGVLGQHRIELLEEEEREKTTLIVAFDDDFLTGKQRHVSNSDLSRQQVRPNGSDML